MRGRTRKDRDYPRAFILDVDGLKSVASVLQQTASDETQIDDKFSSLSFTATLSDESKLIDYTFDEFLAFSNNKERQVTQLEIEPIGQSNLGLRIKFKNADFLDSPISYSLSGDDDQVVVWSNRLDDQIKAITPWYWWIARYSVLVWIWAILLPVLLAIGIVEALDDLFFPNLLPDAQPDNGSLVSGLSRGLLISLPFFALELFRNYLFPKADFAIGAGKQRSGVRATVRKAVVGFVCITVPLAVLTALLR